MGIKIARVNRRPLHERSLAERQSQFEQLIRRDPILGKYLRVNHPLIAFVPHLMSESLLLSLSVRGREPSVMATAPVFDLQQQTDRIEERRFYAGLMSALRGLLFVALGADTLAERLTLPLLTAGGIDWTAVRQFLTLSTAALPLALEFHEDANELMVMIQPTEIPFWPNVLTLDKAFMDARYQADPDAEHRFRIGEALRDHLLIHLSRGIFALKTEAEGLFETQAGEQVASTAREAAALLRASRPRLAVCLIARDEADVIGACLQSVQGLADDVLVADTGSGDATAELARALGARVVAVPWADDFAAARNAALAQVDAEWVLVLDADERLEPGAAEQIRQILAQPTPEDTAVRLRIISQGVEQLQPRLFRGRPTYAGIIHEQPVSVRQTIDAPDVRILHAGYDPERLVGKVKIERNLALIERALTADPDNALLWFYLGATHHEAGDLETACDAYGTSRSRAPTDAPWLCLLYAYAAEALIARGRPAEALAFFEGVPPAAFDTPETLLQWAYAHAAVGNPGRARVLAERALVITPPGAVQDPSVPARAQALIQSLDALAVPDAVA